MVLGTPSMIPDEPDYGLDAMGLLMLVGFLGMVKLFILYRANKNRRYLRALVGAGLLVVSAGVGAFSGLGFLALVMCIPGVALVVANLPVRFWFRHDERLERNRAEDAAPKCQNCGYELRGTIAAGIYTCPECNERASDEVISAWKEVATPQQEESSSPPPRADSS